jgi:hypothetical protein
MEPDKGDAAAVKTLLDTQIIARRHPWAGSFELQCRVESVCGISSLAKDSLCVTHVQIMVCRFQVPRNGIGN